MPYITSIEQIAIEQGIQKGIQEGTQRGLLQKAREDIVEALTIRFETVPQALIEAIEMLDDSAVLKELFRQAVLVESVEKFKWGLDSLLTDSIEVKKDQ